MNIELVSPKIADAVLWQKVRTQDSTQQNNPMGILKLEELEKQIAESNQPIKKRQKAHRYLIKEQKTGKFLGVIVLKDINWESGVAEVGYLIDEEVHSQGVATKALRLILKIAFDEGGLNKIKATTIVQNTPSYRVLEKNGFQREGTLRQEFLVQGKLHDVHTWSILRREFN